MDTLAPLNPAGSLGGGPPDTVRRPAVWSIAGSDSGAGAGLQADLRAFDAMAVLGCTAVAALTAQSSLRVDRVDPVPTHLLAAQLDTLAADMPPRAVKTGLLGSVDNLRLVARCLDALRRQRPVALVVDPVWRATTGADLAGAPLRQALLDELLPRATVLTPNRAEAAWLLGLPAAALDHAAAVEQAASALQRLGPGAVVITGGDAGGDRSLDWMASPQTHGWLGAERVATRHHHGSGCVFAATLAAALALDFCEADAVVLAKMATLQALREGEAAGSAGGGAGAARPIPGFARRTANLPTLHATHPAAAAPAPPAFAALADPALGLYAVVDSAEWVDRLLAAGVRTLQLRIKGGDPAWLSTQVRRSVQAARAAGAQLFINDHAALAVEHHAYGVHLGQEDLLTADLPALRAAGLRLGLSTHSLWELCRAHALRPSYVACGPVHPTVTKDMPWRPQGSHNLAWWCQVLPVPVVAIAGMDEARSADAARCGAAGVAVLRGIATASEPAVAVARLQSSIDSGRRQARWPAPALPRSSLAPAWSAPAGSTVVAG